MEIKKILFDGGPLVCMKASSTKFPRFLTLPLKKNAYKALFNEVQ